MSNNHDADARDTVPVESAPFTPHASTADAPHSEAIQAPAYRASFTDDGSIPGDQVAREKVTGDKVTEDKRVSRGWLIAAVAAGGALLLALAFGGGVATGLGIDAISRGGFVAEQGPGPMG